MNFSHANQLNYVNQQNVRGSLWRAVLGHDFIAGIDLASFRWQVIPLREVLEIRFETLRNSLTKPLIERDGSLLEHLEQLLDQVVTVELTSERFIRAELKDLNGQLAILESETGLLAVPIASIRSIWLWKTQNQNIEPVSAFNSQKGEGDENF